MMKARSPNIADYGVNKHYATGPYHTVAGFLVENDDCKLETNWFSQSACPAENKNGFYLNDEMSPDWADLDQTQVSSKGSLQLIYLGKGLHSLDSSEFFQVHHVQRKT